MPTIANVLATFRENPEPSEGSSTNPFKLSTTMDEPATGEEIQAAWPFRRLPGQLVDAWLTTRRATLFADVEYGQWGLVLLSPKESAARTALEAGSRPGDFESSDVVVGEFLGDQELVVLTEVGGNSQVLIALPLEGRAEWDCAAEDLAEFLTAYFEHGGDKYWEQGPVSC